MIWQTQSGDMIVPPPRAALITGPHRLPAAVGDSRSVAAVPGPAEIDDGCATAGVHNVAEREREGNAGDWAYLTW